MKERDVEAQTNNAGDHLPAKDQASGPIFRSWIDPQNVPVIESLVTSHQSEISTHFSKMKEGYTGANIPGVDDDTTNPYTWKSRQPTRAEEIILYYIAAGLDNHEISAILQTSFHTVKNQTTRLLGRYGQKNKYGATLRAIEDGVVEPLLIDVQADFSGYPDMSVREKQVYGLISQPGSASNREIADRLFITETTVKNHATSVFAKLKIANRGEAVMYDVKRKERILLGDQDSDDLSDQQKGILNLLSIEPSLRESAVNRYSLGIFKPTEEIKDIYRKLGVGNLMECAAVALLHNYCENGHFATEEEQAAIEGLGEDSKSLLLKFGDFPDDTCLSERADRLGMSLMQLKGEIKKILENSDVPSIYQSIVILQLAQLKKERESLKERQRKITEIRTALSPQAETSEARHNFYDNQQIESGQYQETLNQNI